MCLVTKCGTFTVKVSTAASDTHTAGTETSPTLTVNKANDTATAPMAKTVTYYGSAQELVNAGSTNDGTLYYAVTAEDNAPADSLYATSIPAKTDAGTYYVWYKVVADAEHNDSAPGYVIATISSRPSPSSGGSYTPTTYNVTFKVVNGSWFVCEYRATRREELTNLLLSSGCSQVIWKFPEESGFYQPIVIVRKLKFQLNKIAARWPARAVAQFYFID